MTEEPTQTGASRRKGVKQAPRKGAQSLPSRRRNAVQTKPPPPITSRGRATRERLKQALSTLLQERAFHDIRLEDITREAGVRVSLFYHYFQSKIDITHELLSEMLESFKGDVASRAKEMTAFDSIHYANQRMAALYAANPGAMRCLLEVHEGAAPFAPMWRKLTLEWNQRIGHSLARQFPKAFGSSEEYLSIAYALAGSADNLLYEYYVLRNPALRTAHPTDEDIARLITTLWHRTLYLTNPSNSFLGKPLAGFRKLGGGESK